jgi:hypothetical protein
MGWATHTRHKIRATIRTQVTTWALNTTQRVLYSNGALVAITKNRMRGNEVLVFRNAQGMLGVLLHAPRGPFYSPKAARSRWEHSRKANLAFCRLAHRTVRCTTGHCPVRISFLFWAADRWRLGAVGAPDTVRCTPDSPVLPSDRWPSHASCADCAADRWRARPMAHVRCWLGSRSRLTGHCPVHHRTVRWFIAIRRRRDPRAASWSDASLAHRTLSGAPPDSPVHPDWAESWLLGPSLFQLYFLWF